jgi:hypothetical protein
MSGRRVVHLIATILAGSSAHAQQHRLGWPPYVPGMLFKLTLGWVQQHVGMEDIEKAARLGRSSRLPLEPRRLGERTQAPSPLK